MVTHVFVVMWGPRGYPLVLPTLLHAARGVLARQRTTMGEVLKNRLIRRWTMYIQQGGRGLMRPCSLLGITPCWRFQPCALSFEERLKKGSEVFRSDRHFCATSAILEFYHGPCVVFSEWHLQKTASCGFIVWFFFPIEGEPIPANSRLLGNSEFLNLIVSRRYIDSF